MSTKCDESKMSIFLNEMWSTDLDIHSISYQNALMILSYKIANQQKQREYKKYFDQFVGNIGNTLNDPEFFFDNLEYEFLNNDEDNVYLDVEQSEYMIHIYNLIIEYSKFMNDEEVLMFRYNIDMLKDYMENVRVIKDGVILSFSNLNVHKTC